MSPLATAAAVIAMSAIEYMRKMNSSWPTPKDFIMLSLMLEMAPSHNNEIVLSAAILSVRVAGINIRNFDCQLTSMTTPMG